MDYSNFPGNSQKDSASKPQEKKFEPVGNGSLTKPSTAKKLFSAVIGGTIDDVKNHTIYDVIIPGFKRLIQDGINIIFWGDTRTRTSAPTSNSRTSYTSFWSQPATAAPIPKVASSNRHVRFEYCDVGFETDLEAVDLREQLDAAIDRYGSLSVADMYEMARIPDYPSTANDYGWYNIKGAEIVKIPNLDKPWVVKMPPMVQLKK